MAIISTVPKITIKSSTRKSLSLHEIFYTWLIVKRSVKVVFNRQIGGEAPSKYSRKIIKAAEIDEEQLRLRVESHLVNYDAFIQDDFDAYFIDRAKAIMKVIESAMGKTISDKGSEQTINLYSVSLEDES